MNKNRTINILSTSRTSATVLLLTQPTGFRANNFQTSIKTKKRMKTMTQRKQYARPQMTVVELRHQCCILAGSPGEQQRGADREDYESYEW